MNFGNNNTTNSTGTASAFASAFSNTQSAFGTGAGAGAGAFGRPNTPGGAKQPNGGNAKWQNSGNRNQNNDQSRPKKPWKAGNNRGRGGGFSGTNHFQKRKTPMDSSKVTAPGFKPRQYDQRPTPAYLLPGQSYLFSVNVTPNNWDVQNQQAMLNAERQSNPNNMQQLYETLQAMREEERKQMEKLGLVDRQDVRKDLKDAISFVGSCQNMCPTFERIRRTYENNVKQMEKDPKTGKVSTEFAVKAFSRPAAGQPPPLPSDVRPPKVLRTTLDYLIHNALTQLPSSHGFLWDRTRSIRQDFTYQNYAGEEAVECNEIIARIHIVCLHVMAGSDQEYSKQQELEQFNKTLQTLSEFYAERRKKGLPDSRNEPEIRAYQLLSHLKDPQIERQIQKLPQYIIESNEVQMALNLRALIQQNRPNQKHTENCSNFFAVFFNQLRDTPFLLACLIESSINELRLGAFQSLSRACHARSKPYSIARLTEVMAFDNDQETIAFCNHYKLPVADTTIEVTAFSDRVVAEQQALAQPFSYLVDGKIRGRQLADIVLNGDAVGKPQSSFNFAAAASKSQSKPQPQPQLQFGQQPQFAPQSQTQSQTQMFKPQTQTSLFQNQNQAPSQPPAEKKPQPAFSLFPPSQQGAVPPQKQPQLQTEPQKQPTFALNQPQEQPKPPPVVKAAPPAPKSPPKPKFTDQDVEAIYNQMLRQVYKTREVGLDAVWNSILETRRCREQFIDNAARAVLREMVQEATKTQAELAFAIHFDNQRIKRSVLKVVQRTASESKQRADTKRKLTEELTSVSQQLGRSNSSSNQSRRRSQQRRKRGRGPEDVLDVIESATTEAKELWRPLDINQLVVRHLEPKLAKASSSNYHSLLMSVFCEDWDSPTGQWLRTKFAMELTSTQPLSEKVPISCYRAQYQKLDVYSLVNCDKLFERTGILVFECGIRAAQVDRERLHEIRNTLNAKSRFRVKLLLLYFGGMKSEIEILRELDCNDGSAICALVGGGGVDPSRRLEAALTRLANVYQPQLSAYGRQQEKEVLNEQKLAKLLREERSLNDRRRAEEELLKQRHDKLGQYQYLRQHQYEHTLPRVFSANPTNTRAPAKRQIDEVTQSAAADYMPKRLAKLDNLVNSLVKKPRN